jgi:hypothetical protein
VFIPSQVAGAELVTVEESQGGTFYLQPDGYLLGFINHGPRNYRTTVLDNGTECYYFNITVLTQTFNFEYNGTFMFELFYFEPDVGENGTLYLDYANTFNISEGNEASVPYSRYVGVTKEGVGRDRTNPSMYYFGFVILSSLAESPIKVHFEITTTFEAWVLTDPSEMPDDEWYWGWPAGNTTRYDSTVYVPSEDNGNTSTLPFLSAPIEDYESYVEHVEFLRYVTIAMSFGSFVLGMVVVHIIWIRKGNPMEAV